MQDLLKYTEQCFGPVAGILLVIGAGGAFNKVLLDSGLGVKLGEILTSLDMNSLLLAWFVAAIMRFSVGSATVSMMTSAGIVLPMLPQYPNLDRLPGSRFRCHLLLARHGFRLLDCQGVFRPDGAGCPEVVYGSDMRGLADGN